MDVEREILELKRRVGDLEAAVNVLSDRIGTLGPDLKELGATAQARFDTLDGMVLRIVTRLDTMNTQVWSLRDDMPILIADALQKARRSLD